MVIVNFLEMFLAVFSTVHDQYGESVTISMPCIHGKRHCMSTTAAKTPPEPQGRIGERQFLLMIGRNRLVMPVI